MPRKTRMYLPGIPAHVVQRGNNREACFFCDTDYLYYKALLGEGLNRYGGNLHAYCLMTNHVHLLITPEAPDSISRIIQHVGRQYVQYINRVYRRSGTLWEGRHKGSLIEAEAYLLTCYRYIELNPVTAGMTAVPDEYRWSSYRANAWSECDELVVRHDLFQALGSNEDERCYAYRELFKIAIPEVDIHQLRQSILKNYPVGNDRFKAQVEAALGRCIGTGQRGRPSKVVKE